MSSNKTNSCEESLAKTQLIEKQNFESFNLIKDYGVVL